MRTVGNPAFVTIHELSPSEYAMLRMRQKQYPRTLRDGMNPDLVVNLIPFGHQIRDVEIKYWRDVCRISAKQQIARTILERPTPPKSLSRAFITYITNEN